MFKPNFGVIIVSAEGASEKLECFIREHYMTSSFSNSMGVHSQPPCTPPADAHASVVLFCGHDIAKKEKKTRRKQQTCRDIVCEGVTASPSNEMRWYKI